MTIANAMREFFFKLTGTKPNGLNIASVIRAGSVNVPNLSTLNGAAIKYEEGNKSFILNSSTADSTKRFRITVIDDGTLTATEIVETP